MKLTWVWSALGVLLLVVGGSWLALRDSSPQYETIAVVREPIVQEISARGRVEPPVQVNLHFKGMGNLTQKNILVGDDVRAGDILARQDVRELSAQLSQVSADVNVQRARLTQLLAGSNPEEVHLAQIAVSNAQKIVESKQSLLLKALKDAYTIADDVVRTKTDFLFTNSSIDSRLTFTVNNQSLQSVAEQQRFLVEGILLQWKDIVHTPDSSSVKVVSDNLREVTILLDYLAQTLNAFVTGESPATIENAKVTVSIARTTIHATQQAIISAEEALNTALGALSSAEQALSLRSASPRQEDVSLYQAEIRRAESARVGIEAQLRIAEIVAPVAGIVTRVTGEIGELVGPGDTIVSLMPKGDLQVRADISEGNIIDVTVGQKVRVKLDAFPLDEEWSGTVLQIYPAETIVGGAVYYETIISLDTADARIRRGMSANVWVETARHESALVVPASAITLREGKRSVRVLAGGIAEEREIVTGITSGQGMIEVVSGLEEGEVVILGTI